MSGGHYGYKDGGLLEEMYPHSYWNSDDKRNSLDNPFEDQLISQLMFDLLKLTHDLDWYKSGDTQEETYLKEKTIFCQKWFGPKRSQKVVEGLVRELFEAAMAESKKMIDDLKGDNA